MSKALIEKISKVQSKLKAPKSQYNKFGNYFHRNQEDILEAVKPLLAENGLVQTITDNIISVGGRVYVQSTVTVTDGENFLSNSAFAREPLEQKGMSEPQITGTASSYARKYALGGMYAIDDTKDADATNDHGKAYNLAQTVQQANVNVKSGKITSPDQYLAALEIKEPTKEAPKSGGRFAPKNKPAEVERQQFSPADVEQADDGWD